MTARKLWGSTAALLAAIAALATAAAPAPAATTTYHPAEGARTFADNLAGWRGSQGAEGACVIPLLCPTVANTYAPSGGADGTGDGYLRSSFGPLLGAAGERFAIWRSPGFLYRGAQGQFPDTVTFDLDRRADVDALLSVATNDATYTVQLVDQADGSAIELTGPDALEGAPGWTGIETESINPRRLTIGHSYFFRITSRIAFGVDVLPDSTAEYDNVVLEAEIDRPLGDPCETRVLGTQGPDELTGTQGGDEMKGFKGGDRLKALGGADCASGGPGQDTISGSGGKDELRGNDAADVVRGGTGKDTIFGGAGADRLRGVAGNDLLKGGADADNVTGAKGADELRGSGGNDTLRGGADPDRLDGGNGSDLLVGLTDRDTIRAGSGKDLIRAGGGRDLIKGGTGRDKINAGAGGDTITSRGGGKDRVKCGGGRDRVNADRKDRVGSSCEVVKVGGRG